MSSSELAERCDVTEQAVRHWESGRGEPSGVKRRSAVERSLSFRVQWTPDAPGLPAHGEISPEDHQMLTLYARLRPEVKAAAKAMLQAAAAL